MTHALWVAEAAEGGTNRLVMLGAPGACSNLPLTHAAPRCFHTEIQSNYFSFKMVAHKSHASKQPASVSSCKSLGDNQLGRFRGMEGASISFRLCGTGIGALALESENLSSNSVADASCLCNFEKGYLRK